MRQSENWERALWELNRELRHHPLKLRAEQLKASIGAMTKLRTYLAKVREVDGWAQVSKQ